MTATPPGPRVSRRLVLAVALAALASMPAASARGQADATRPTDAGRDAPVATAAAGVTAAAAPDPATSRWGAAHVFHVDYTPSVSPVPLLRLHSWTVHVTDAAGAPVDGAGLSVVGGMPEHSHGFPTVPDVTALGGGDYRVEGLKFHMPGKWTVVLGIRRGDHDRDTVRFDVEVR